MSIEMRPRFSMYVDQPADEVLASLRDAINNSEDCPCYADVYVRQLEIRMRDRHHHFWSPELNLLFREKEDALTHLEGKFGPGAHVWTAFMAGYAAFGLTAVGGGLLALSQWTIDEPTTGIWMVLVGLVGCVFVYLAAQVGQRLAGPQIGQIRAEICKVFPQCCEEQ